jgi:hypothetical protein
MAGEDLSTRDMLRVTEHERKLISFLQGYRDHEAASEVDGIVHLFAKVAVRLENLEDKKDFMERYVEKPVNMAGPMDPRVEAFLQLHRDLNTILANNWSDTSSMEVRQRIAMAMQRSLQTFI